MANIHAVSKAHTPQENIAARQIPKTNAHAMNRSQDICRIDVAESVIVITKSNRKILRIKRYRTFNPCCKSTRKAD